MSAKMAFLTRHDSHDSPKVHRAGVKHETAENDIYIVEKKNSLSSFSYSPALPPTRVCVRPRECWGETRATCPSPRLATFAPTSAGVGPRWPSRKRLAPFAAGPPLRNTSPPVGPRSVCQSGSARGGERVLPVNLGKLRHAGTAAVLDRVCFECPK